VVVSLPPRPRAADSTTAIVPPSRAEKIATGQRVRDVVMGLGGCGKSLKAM
jgi:hypothetical protein